MKNIIIPTIIISLSLFLISCSSLPNDPPSLKITTSNITYNTHTNGGTWFNNSNDNFGGNSFDLGMTNFEKLKLIEEIQIPCDTEITLNLSYLKDIASFKVYSIQGDDLIEIENSNYIIVTPSTSGEYGYLIEAKWDETHNMNFIFKVNCKTI